MGLCEGVGFFAGVKKGNDPKARLSNPGMIRRYVGVYEHAIRLRIFEDGDAAGNPHLRKPVAHRIFGPIAPQFLVFLRLLNLFHPRRVHSEHETALVWLPHNLEKCRGGLRVGRPRIGTLRRANRLSRLGGRLIASMSPHVAQVVW